MPQQASYQRVGVGPPNVPNDTSRHGARPAVSVSYMDTCRITCADGGTIDVRGELQTVVEELHKVFTRREHTFAILHDLSGTVVAVRPEAVLHVRPVDAVD
jgi:hypothetical protein